MVKNDFRGQVVSYGSEDGTTEVVRMVTTFFGNVAETTYDVVPDADISKHTAASAKIREMLSAELLPAIDSFVAKLADQRSPNGETAIWSVIKATPDIGERVSAAVEQSINELTYRLVAELRPKE